MTISCFTLIYFEISHVYILDYSYFASSFLNSKKCITVFLFGLRTFDAEVEKILFYKNRLDCLV